MRHEDPRGELNRDAIKESADRDLVERENPGKFKPEDEIGRHTGVGYLYKKGDRWGYQEWYDDFDDNPIIELEFVPDDVDLTKEQLNELEEICSGYEQSTFAVGEVDGKPVVVRMEAWEKTDIGIQVRVRNANGWVEKK